MENVLLAGITGAKREDNPIVSIVVPTYNAEKLLTECITSLFNQTYPKECYEIIVVDDGSTDKTNETINELTQSSPCALQYFYQKNKGPAAARNTGIKNAKGEIVAFTDVDCLADKDWLKNLRSCFTNDIDGVAGKVIPLGNTPFTYYVAILEGGSFCTANIAYKKDVLYEVGMFDEVFRAVSYEDTDLGFRVIEFGKNIIFCDAAVVRHQIPNFKLIDIAKTRSQVRDTIKFLKKFSDSKIDEHKKFSRHLLWGWPLYPFFMTIRWKGYLLRHPLQIPKFILRVGLMTGIRAYTSIIYVFEVIKDKIKQ